MPNEVLWRVGPGYRVYPPKLNMCTEVLDRHVTEGRGDAPAVVWQGGRWTFAELQKVVNAYAAKAKENGIGVGDRMLVLGRNSPQGVATVLAGLKIGAVPVLLSSLLSESEIDYIIDNSGARVAFAPSANAQALRELLAKGRLDRLFILQGSVEGAKEVDCSGFERLDVGEVATLDTGADEAFFVYSSGTTGRPKGIVHAHRWVVALGDSNSFAYTAGKTSRRSPPANRASSARSAMTCFPLTRRRHRRDPRTGTPGSVCFWRRWRSSRHRAVFGGDGLSLRPGDGGVENQCEPLVLARL